MTSATGARYGWMIAPSVASSGTCSSARDAARSSSASPPPASHSRACASVTSSRENGTADVRCELEQRPVLRRFHQQMIGIRDAAEFESIRSEPGLSRSSH